jgi:hypothetical protein
LVDDHVSLALLPFVMYAGDACNVTVGAGGAGGAVGGAIRALATLLWQPPKKMTPLKTRNKTVRAELFVVMDSS